MLKGKEKMNRTGDGNICGKRETKGRTAKNIPSPVL